jgi:hypothetical protein
MTKDEISNEPVEELAEQETSLVDPPKEPKSPEKEPTGGVDKAKEILRSQVAFYRDHPDLRRELLKELGATPKEEVKETEELVMELLLDRDVNAILDEFPALSKEDKRELRQVAKSGDMELVERMAKRLSTNTKSGTESKDGNPREDDQPDLPTYSGNKSQAEKVRDEYAARLDKESARIRARYRSR